MELHRKTDYQNAKNGNDAAWYKLGGQSLKTGLVHAEDSWRRVERHSCVRWREEGLYRISKHSMPPLEFINVGHGSSRFDVSIEEACVGCLPGVPVFRAVNGQTGDSAVVREQHAVIADVSVGQQDRRCTLADL